MSESLGSIFKSLDQYEIDTLYMMYGPTVDNVLAYFKWKASTPEERVDSISKCMSGVLMKTSCLLYYSLQQDPQMPNVGHLLK